MCRKCWHLMDNKKTHDDSSQLCRWYYTENVLKRQIKRNKHQTVASRGWGGWWFRRPRHLFLVPCNKLYMLYENSYVSFTGLCFRGWFWHTYQWIDLLSSALINSQKTADRLSENNDQKGCLHSASLQTLSRISQYTRTYCIYSFSVCVHVYTAMYICLAGCHKVYIMSFVGTDGRTVESLEWKFNDRLVSRLAVRWLFRLTPTCRQPKSDGV